MVPDQAGTDLPVGMVTFLVAEPDPSFHRGDAVAGAATGTMEPSGDLVWPVVAAHKGVYLDGRDDDADRAVAVFV